MQTLGERRTPEAQPLQPQYPTPTLTTLSTATTTDIELAQLKAWKQGAVGAFNVVSGILAARVIVLVAVVGGIVLTYLALGNSDPVRLVPLGIYSLLVVVPSVWLASRK